MSAIRSATAPPRRRASRRTAPRPAPCGRVARWRRRRSAQRIGGRAPAWAPAGRFALDCNVPTGNNRSWPGVSAGGGLCLDADDAGTRLASGRRSQGRQGRLRAPLPGDPGETLWRRASYIASSRPCGRGHPGGLPQGLERGRAVRPGARFADHLDGGDRPQPRHRPGAQEVGDIDRRGARGAGSRGREPPSAGEARDERRAETASRLHGRPRRGAPPPGAARLLQRLEPRPARRQVRQARQHHQDMAATLARRDSGVPRDMTLDDSQHTPDEAPEELTPNTRAAEYVLGTLDPAERAEAQALISSDPAFAALVRDWEGRLGELHALADSVDPPAAVWDAIKAKLPETEQTAPFRLPEIPPPPPPPPRLPPNVIALSNRMVRWRMVAAATGTMAAVFALFIITSTVAPTVLPDSLRPRPRVIVQVTEGVAPPPARFVAVLQRDATSPAFILTVDIANRSLTVRRGGRGGRAA